MVGRLLAGVALAALIATPAFAQVGPPPSSGGGNLTGPITSTGLATAIASQTGTGTKFVMDTSPTLVTPTLGVASATSEAIAAAAGAGFEEFGAQSATPATPAANTYRQFGDATGRFSWVGSNGFVRTLDGTGLTASRVFTLPDASITFARSDAAQTFTGVQTFSSNPIMSGLSNSVPVCTNGSAALTSTCSNLVTNAILATATQNTVKGAATSTAEADLAMPSCNTQTAALQWTTNTGYSCNSTIKATSVAPAGLGITSIAMSGCTEAGTGSPTCSMTATNGSLGAKITLASSSAATTISITETAATNGWVCSGFDATTTTIRLKQTGNSTTGATLTFYNDAGTATSPGATDVLWLMCLGV